MIGRKVWSRAVYRSYRTSLEKQLPRAKNKSFFLSNQSVIMRSSLLNHTEGTSKYITQPRRKPTDVSSARMKQHHHSVQRLHDLSAQEPRQ